MDSYTFDRPSVDRIARAVRGWEKRSLRPHGVRKRRGGGRDHVTFLGKLTADLAYNGTDDVEILQGTVGSESVPGTPKTIEAHNILFRTLWEDSFVLLQWVAADNSNGSMYRIIWSDSASRLRGMTDGTITTGSSGTVDGLVLIDGKFTPTSLTAFNVTSEYGTIENDVIVWVEWVQANQRWEIYGADCNPAA